MQNGECPWAAFLDEVMASNSKHYLWLKALSYLEYIGYRKMVKALGYEGDKGVVHHLTDEIQHSYMLGELADKYYGEHADDSGFGDAFRQIAETYFQAIDQCIHETLLSSVGKDESYLCYLLVSYIIEKRAMKVYPQYLSRLKDAPSKYTVQKIIRDESEHLNYLENKIQALPQFSDISRQKLLDFEDEKFSTMLGSLRERFVGLSLAS